MNKLLRFHANYAVGAEDISDNLNLWKFRNHCACGRLTGIEPLSFSLSLSVWDGFSQMCRLHPCCRAHGLSAYCILVSPRMPYARHTHTVSNKPKKHANKHPIHTQSWQCANLPANASSVPHHAWRRVEKTPHGVNQLVYISIAFRQSSIASACGSLKHSFCLQLLKPATHRGGVQQGTRGSAWTHPRRKSL